MTRRRLMPSRLMLELLRLGRCQMGEYGCNRRPVGTWVFGTLRVRLCGQCQASLAAQLGDDLGWTADAAR